MGDSWAFSGRLCSRCKSEPARYGMTWGINCDLPEVNLLRKSSGLPPLTREEYEAQFPLEKRPLSPPQSLLCWECKSCGHERWAKNGPGACPGCGKECPTWIGRREGTESSCEPLGLTFADLRAVDVERCNTAFGTTNKLMDWSPTDWATSLAGEVGEACNFIKKMRRGDPVPVEDVAKELADVVIYADLLAARLGIDLGAAVVAKFNGGLGEGGIGDSTAR